MSHSDGALAEINYISNFNQVDLINVHSERHAHWSESVEWRAGRWDAMSSAPTRGNIIMNIRGRSENGEILEPMHYACGGGEEQPPFEGWFLPYKSGSGFYQVRPVEWQPLRAQVSEHTDK